MSVQIGTQPFERMAAERMAALTHERRTKHLRDHLEATLMTRAVIEDVMRQSQLLTGLDSAADIAAQEGVSERSVYGNLIHIRDALGLPTEGKSGLTRLALHHYMLGLIPCICEH